MKLVEMSYTEMIILTRYQSCIDELLLAINTVTRSSDFRVRGRRAEV